MAVVVMLALLGGCADSATAADAHWAAMMVPHHTAGIALDDLALARTDDVRVRHLAFEMNGYQGAEQDELRRLAGNAHTSTMATGIPTAAEMEDFGTRTGVDFDRTFLALMIRHHEGALAMTAAATLSAGVRHRLADDLVTVQTAQLARMQALFTELGGLG